MNIITIIKVLVSKLKMWMWVINNPHEIPVVEENLDGSYKIR